nr:hypothetical protein [Tanacetum cinerariifolium]
YESQALVLLPIIIGAAVQTYCTQALAPAGPARLAARLAAAAAGLLPAGRAAAGHCDAGGAVCARRLGAGPRPPLGRGRATDPRYGAVRGGYDGSVLQAHLGLSRQVAVFPDWGRAAAHAELVL